MSKRLVLLGAGASHEAGLPTSVGLTRAVVDHMDGNLGYQFARLNDSLHAVLGAMVAYDTLRQSGVYEGIDVERAFAAVQNLATRDTLEISPFVTWNQAATVGASGRLPTNWGKRLAAAVQGTSIQSGSEIEDLIKEAIVSVVQDTADLTFEKLASAMLSSLEVVLKVNPASIDYLAPLLSDTDAEPINLVTLNYDESLEALCDRAGYAYDTGLGNWNGGFGWEWNVDAKVRILKLHGSLGWQLGDDMSEEHSISGRKLVRTRDIPAGQSNGLRNGRPALVFGQGSKLRSDGPFLAMLVEFDRLLSQSDQLIMIGYSLRDDHVNEMVRRWLYDDLKRSVTVLNPAIETWAQSPHLSPFYRELTQTKWRNGEQVRSLNDFRADKTGTGLAQLFGSGPSLAAVPAPA